MSWDVEQTKKIQAVILEIADVVVDICERHNIKYFLVGGSLLGAIRHEGFIPWDDDFDIGMPIKHFLRFLKICKKELPKEFFLQTQFTDRAWYQFVKIRKNNTTFREDTIYDSLKYTYHRGMFIDIFPFRYSNREKKLLKLRDWIIKQIGSLSRGAIWHRKHKGVKKIIGILTPRKLFYRLYLKSMTYTDEKSATHIVHPLTRYSTAMFPIEMFNTTIKHGFEGRKLEIPVGWEQYLKTIYGDYMKLPPEEERGLWHNVIKVDFEKGGFE